MKILLSDKSPFLLTLLFAVLGYQFNTLVSSIMNTPAIEYSLSAEGDSVKLITCEIVNLSKEKSFKDLVINFKYADPPYFELFDPKLKSITPSSIHHDQPKEYLNEIIEFKVPHIQPGFKYLMTFKIRVGDKKFRYPEIYLTTNDAVRLLSRSLSTILAKNQLFLNVIITVIWIILIICYLIYYSKNYKNEL